MHLLSSSIVRPGLGISAALVLLSATATSRAAGELHVVVDSRVELLSTVFRLAGHPEYRKGMVRSYTSDVDRHFGKFREHAVVGMARELRRKRGVSYDAVMAYAIHLTPELEAAKPFDPRPDSLDSRWHPEEAQEFLEKLQRFAKDSGFRKFYDDHKELYGIAVNRMKLVAEEDGDLGWFDRFFGAKPGARFTLVLGMLNGPNCYGVRAVGNDGNEDLYCVLGVWSTDWRGRPKFTAKMLPTVAHEFCHSYVNPLVYANQEKLRDAGEAIFPWVEEEMTRQAYANWVTMMHESLVRASVVRYVQATEGEHAAKKRAALQVERHFLWTPKLAGLLADYEADRETYPNFQAFLPKVIEFFNQYAGEFVQEQKSRIDGSRE